VRKHEPGVKLHVITTVLSPSHALCSAITFACVQMSCGESCGSSLGCVWIHPRGSISPRYSWEGRAVGRCTVWWVPHCDGSTMQRTSLTLIYSSSDTDGQMWWGSVTVVLSGLVRSLLTWRLRMIRINLL